MNQLNFTIDSDKYLAKLLNSNLNVAAKVIIITLLNQVMEAEHDH